MIVALPPVKAICKAARIELCHTLTIRSVIQKQIDRLQTVCLHGRLKRTVPILRGDKIRVGILFEQQMSRCEPIQHRRDYEWRRPMGVGVVDTGSLFEQYQCAFPIYCALLQE